MADKRAFIRELAKYLVQDQVQKGLELRLNYSDAVTWRSVRNTTPVFGYVGQEEAERVLSEWLGIEMRDDHGEDQREGGRADSEGKQEIQR